MPWLGAPEMDAAAEQAMRELQSKVDSLTPAELDVFYTIREWWTRHYRTAGHKRLGRVLMVVSKRVKEE